MRFQSEGPKINSLLGPHQLISEERKRGKLENWNSVPLSGVEIEIMYVSFHVPVFTTPKRIQKAFDFYWLTDFCWCCFYVTGLTKLPSMVWPLLWSRLAWNFWSSCFWSQACTTMPNMKRPLSSTSGVGLPTRFNTATSYKYPLRVWVAKVHLNNYQIILPCGAEPQTQGPEHAKNKFYYWVSPKTQTC